MPYPCIWKCGGSFLKFAKIWETIKDDVWVLDSVSEEVKLDFVVVPRQSRFSFPVSMSKEMANVCDKEANDLQDKKAIVQISNGGWVCLFAFCDFQEIGWYLANCQS